MKNDQEPSLENIEDYNGKESKEKKATVRNVVIIALLIAAVFSYFSTDSLSPDYVGTPEKPGIIGVKK